MSAVRSTGNRSTEVVLAKALRRGRVSGWKRHLQIAIGPSKVRPDFVFPLTKVVVFVDGCFWHSCPIHGTQPSSRKDFWLQKLTANRRRDRRVSDALRHRGWRVIRIWEHSVKKNIDGCVERIRSAVVA